MKGKRLQLEVVNSLRSAFSGSIADEEIQSPLCSEAGVDVKLSQHARQLIPYSIECKNWDVVKIPVWEWIDQSIRNAYPDTTPIVVFRKNRKSRYAIIPFESFVGLISDYDKRNRDCKE